MEASGALRGYVQSLDEPRETSVGAPSASQGGFGELQGRPRERLGVPFGCPRDKLESFSELRGGFWSGNDEKVKIDVFLKEFDGF